MVVAEEPRPSKGCPRMNGFFRHWDPEACDKFVNCVDGVPNELPCPPGLVYDDEASTCQWPTEALRKDCTHSKRGEPSGGRRPPTSDLLSARL